MSSIISKDLFIVGPTGCGKSDLSLTLAHKLQCPIVNCDSLQFFSDLKIGTAYPSDDDFSKATHLLYGVAMAGTAFTAGEFVRQFEILRQHDLYKNQMFLIVGGSGFYIQALETGMEEIETLTPEMKHKISFLNQLSLKEKIQKLKDVDPESLKNIHIHDEYRIHRALDVFFSQDKKMSEVKKKSATSRHAKLGLYLDRDELLKKISDRVDRMLNLGLIEEVQGLIKKGLSDWKPLQSVGYKEVQMYLEDQISKDQMTSMIIKNTMHLAKRQMTWFRADPKVVWFHAEKEKSKALSWVIDKSNMEKP